MSQVTLSDTEQTLNPASEAFFLRRRPAIYGCTLVACLLLSSCSDSKTSSSVSKSKLSSPESSEQDAVVADEDNNTNSKNPQQNAAKLKVLSPNGHEYLIKGKTTSITWKKGDGGKFVTISLLKGGKAYKTVVKKTKNDGDHSWKIPKSIASSSGYKIKVSSFTTKTISDLSNHSFAIQDADTGTGTGDGWDIAPGELPPSVRTPSSGDRLQVGLPHKITWTFKEGSPTTSLFKWTELFLKKGTKPGRLCYGIDNWGTYGSYTWTITSRDYSNCPWSGDDFYIEIEDYYKPNSQITSGYFTLY